MNHLKASFKRNRRLVVVLALIVLSMLAALPTFAQEATLEIPTDVIFSSTNTWIETFAPIAAIGVGITVALAILGYLGKLIVSAFNVGRR